MAPIAPSTSSFKLPLGVVSPIPTFPEPSIRIYSVLFSPNVIKSDPAFPICIYPILVESTKRWILCAAVVQSLPLLILSLVNINESVFAESLSSLNNVISFPAVVPKVLLELPICNWAPGLVFPIPTFPFAATVIRVKSFVIKFSGAAPPVPIIILLEGAPVNVLITAASAFV